MTQPDNTRIYDLPVNGGDALYRGWDRRVWSGRNWVRLYLFSFITLANAIIFLVLSRMYWSTQTMSGNAGMFFSIWAFVTVGLFVFVRINLAAIPGLIAMQDYRESSWDLLRSTSITRSEIVKAALKSAVSFTMPYFALLMMFDLLIVRMLNGNFEDISEIMWFEWAAMFFGVCGLGMALVALGYIGGFMKRSAIGVVVGTILPLILLLLFAVGMVTWMVMGSEMDIFQIPVEFLVTLVVPEIPYDMAHQGWADQEFMGMELTYMNLALVYWITAGALWWILSLVIGKRRA